MSYREEEKREPGLGECKVNVTRESGGRSGNKGSSDLRAG